MGFRSVFGILDLLGWREKRGMDVKEKRMDSGRVVNSVDWWHQLRLENDMTVMGVQKMGVIKGDGVHLTSRANRVAAVALCYRMKETVTKVEEQRRPEQGDRMKSRRIGVSGR